MNQQQEKNWWGRNWKWFVPVGCLGSLALFAGLIVMILCLVFGVMKSSGVYQDAVAQVKAHPAIQEAIGTPIEEGMLMTGNININGSSGSADISIPVSGPDGKATIYAVATKSGGTWAFSTLSVEMKADGKRIDLLE